MTIIKKILLAGVFILLVLLFRVLETKGTIHWMENGNLSNGQFLLFVIAIFAAYGFMQLIMKVSNRITK